MRDRRSTIESVAGVSSDLRLLVLYASLRLQSIVTSRRFIVELHRLA